jgi:hypothetical protein
VAGCCGGNEPWGSTECRKFLGQMNVAYSEHLTKKALEGYGDLPVLLAKEKKALQGMINSLL